MKSRAISDIKNLDGTKEIEKMFHEEIQLIEEEENSINFIERIKKGETESQIIAKKIYNEGYKDGLKRFLELIK